MKITTAIVFILAIAVAGLFVTQKSESFDERRPTTDKIKKASFARLTEIRNRKKNEVSNISVR